jgi:hypothetical protein
VEEVQKILGIFSGKIDLLLLLTLTFLFSATTVTGMTWLVLFDVV